MFFIGKYNFWKALNTYSLLFSLYFVRTDIETHLEILKILEKIFQFLSTHTNVSSIDNDDKKSFLFVSLKLCVGILLNYYPNITDDSQLCSIFQMKLNLDNTNNIQIVELISSTVKLIYELSKFCTTNESKIILLLLFFSWLLI